MTVRRSTWVTSLSTLSNWRTSSQSEGKNLVSLSKSLEAFGASPLFMGLGEVVGLTCFGFTLTPSSEAPKSAFIEVTSLRDHWLDKRNVHSDWRTNTQNEEAEPVSLSYQTRPIATSPLLFDGLVSIVGFTCFGLPLVATSKISTNIFEEAEDLLDTLATEELIPICSEDGDALLLG